MGKERTNTHSSQSAHKPDRAGFCKTLAKQFWQNAVFACDGQTAVKLALGDLAGGHPFAILSVGKAANAMSLGAHEALGTDVPSLTISKDGHIGESLKDLVSAHKSINFIETSHPVPDVRSLIAGQLALDFVEGLSQDTCLIMLLSGGASALCELLPVGLGLTDLQSLTEEKLATGATIGEINTARSQISLIKKGKILTNFKGHEVKVFLISDVMGEKMETIASGMGMYPDSLPSGQFKHSCSILLSNKDARKTVEALAEKAGLPVIENKENLYGDVYECASSLADILKKGSDGVYVFGGEPTVELPKSPGEGGRAQCLALALAGEIKEIENITCLVAGTDGTDGPTNSAGGIIDCNTFTPTNKANKALEEANSGAFLREAGALFISGPTDTNVMDLAVCLKLSEKQAQQALEKLNQ